MLRLTRIISSKPNFSQPKHFFDRYVAPRPPQQVTTEESDLVKTHVNEAMKLDKTKFAVVQIGKKQYKVSEGDLVRLTDLPLNETVSKGAKYYTGKWIEAKVGEVIACRLRFYSKSPNFKFSLETNFNLCFHRVEQGTIDRWTKFQYFRKTSNSGIQWR